jgi:Ca-activated chloride channel family protein
MAARTECNVSMRLDRAKSLMADLVTELPSARFAFSAFSGLAFTLSEFSWDRQYLMNIIQNGIFIEVVPMPGSDISNALHMIVEKKTGEPPIYEELDYVILLSDGDIDNAAYEKLKELVPPLRDSGITVIGVGIGSDDAIPIPTLDGNGECVADQFERADGREFYTILYDRPIRFLPEETGGAYFHESEQTQLVEYLRTKLTESSEQQVPPVQTKDIGNIFLAISTVILFALIGIRQIW